MIDPILSLAMSLHAHPGAYALLLGSGVSRPAGIPTGWEVVLDLIRRMAVLVGEECDTDPEAWFNNKYEQKLTYSILLDQLFKSQAERSQMLATYFEPTDDEQERGLKVPTQAHRAIAQLVKSGYLKVILTTNFDRLMEQALESAGVSPVIISSPDATEGAMPLVHSRCTLVKLHGDYLDIRTKNTPVELDVYDPRIDGLLDRILDEFGLLVCGWSGEWDTALRKAIERCKGHRFTTYWTAKSPLATAAKTIADQRLAETIMIQNADQFFTQLAEKIDALATFDRPHPLSAKVAVAQTKKYLSEGKYKIQLHDLLMQEVERIVKETSPDCYPISGHFESADVAKRTEAFEALSEIAAGITMIGCYWGNKEHHVLWVKAIDRLANPSRSGSWNTAMQGLRHYPALMLLYAGGIAAVAGGHYDTVCELFNKPKVKNNDRSEDLIRGLFSEVDPDLFKVIPSLQKMKVPRSERLYKVLRQPLRELLPDDEGYTETFDRFEVLQSFWSADIMGWAIPGAFMYRHRSLRENSMLTKIINECKVKGSNWELFKGGFFDGDLARWEKAQELVLQNANHVSWLR